MPKPVKSTAPKALPGEIRISEAAKRLSLTPQGLGKYAKERPGAPIRIDGTAVWVQDPAFFRWREQELCRQAVEEATAKYRAQLDQQGEESSRARQDRANARKAEIEVEQLERTTVRVEEAEALIVKVLNDIRSAHVALPRTWAPKLIGAKTLLEMEQRLHAENVRLMETMAAPSFGDEPEMPEAA